MANQMLRKVLDRLREKGDLLVSEAPIDPKYELGAVLSRFRNERPVLFTKVRGSSVPVAGALYGNRRIILDQLGMTAEDRFGKIMAAIAAPVAPELLQDGPVRRNIVTHNIDLRRLLPVPTSNEEDSAPYLTSGMLVYRDPASGRTHMAVRRIQVNRGNTLNVLVSGASPFLQGLLEDSAAAGRSLECAVVLGYDAPFLLASQLSTHKYGLDKYEVDGGLRGEPLQVTPCHGIDLRVPAHAEIVLEGLIKPGNTGMEGPFAELLGYYSEAAPSPLMEVTAVMHRDEMIFQHAFPCREEHLAYGMIREAEIFSALSSVVDVRDVNLTIGGGCRLHAVVSINKRTEGDGKSAILTVLGAYKDIKHVVVVDTDVDIYDPLDVEFALASRFQASRALVAIPGAMGSPLDVSHLDRGLTDKLGFDATIPLGSGTKKYKRARISVSESIDIGKYFSLKDG
jgi:2,5-furandicarboxylate decarboxylase 1